MLDAERAGVYIFTASSSLIAATCEHRQPHQRRHRCNVFWQVTSSATLNGPEFVGNVMALTSIPSATASTSLGAPAGTQRQRHSHQRPRRGPALHHRRRQRRRHGYRRRRHADAPGTGAGGGPGTAPAADQGTGASTPSQVPAVGELHRAVRRPVVLSAIQQPPVEPGRHLQAPVHVVSERPQGDGQAKGPKGHTYKTRNYHVVGSTMMTVRGPGQPPAEPDPHGAIGQLPTLLYTVVNVHIGFVRRCGRCAFWTRDRRTSHESWVTLLG